MRWVRQASRKLGGPSSRSAKLRVAETASPALKHHASRTCGSVRRQRTTWVCEAQAEEPEIAPLEMLKKENELLRQAIEAADGSVAELEGELEAAGVPFDAATADEPSEDSSAPPAAEAGNEWSPIQVQPDGHLMEEDYGTPSIPEGDGTECLRFDPTLWSHADHIKERYGRYRSLRHAIDENEGGLDKFSQGYKTFGLNRGEHEGKQGIWYREWAPSAKALALVGDFNDWDPKPEHWAFKNPFGVWELFLPDTAEGKSAIEHRSRIKCRLEAESGEWCERIPAWIKWATQAWDEVQFNGCYYEPEVSIRIETERDIQRWRERDGERESERETREMERETEETERERE